MPTIIIADYSTPAPGEHLDPVGQALYDLDSLIDELDKFGPQRLRGDADRIMGAAGKLIEMLGYIEKPRDMGVVTDAIIALRVLQQRRDLETAYRPGRAAQAAE
jgi:hypothetical protein